MRLLLSTDTVGGVWDYTATLARALEREGHTVLLAVIGEPSEEQIAQLPEEIAIECRNDSLEWLLASPAELSATADWLARLSRGWRAELIHLNQMAYTGLARFEAQTLVVVHSDALSWFGEVLHAPPPSEWATYAQLVRQGLSAADLVLAPSRYQADLTRRHFGRVVDVVIHNGVEPPVDESPSPREPMLIAVGRAWDDAKGMGVYDRAVAILGDGAPPAHLIGDLVGPNGARFTPTALSAHGRLPAPEVHRWMASATIYVGTSLYEPFGLAPLEAAQHGCALVLSDIGSFRELWDGAAEFFPRGDARTLARKVEGLLEDPARAQKLASAGRDLARSHFNAERFAREYLELYQRARRPRATRGPNLSSVAPGPVRRRPELDDRCT